MLAKRKWNHILGAHIQVPSASVDDYIQRAKPDIVKTMFSNPDVIQRYKQWNPDAFYILRVYHDLSVPVGHRGDSGARAAAENFFDRVRQEPGIRLFDAVEGPNEVMNDSMSFDMHRWFDAFQCYYRALVKATLGIETVAWNFSTGQGCYGPTENLYGAYRGTIDTHTYFGIHTYDDPFLLSEYDWLRAHGSNDPNWRGTRGVKFLNVLRKYRPDMKWWLFHTEAGMTQAVYHFNGPTEQAKSLPHGGDQGWKCPHLLTKAEDYAGRPYVVNIKRPLSPPDVYQSLMDWSKFWTDNYDNVLACMYQTGGAGDWATHELIPSVTNYIALYQKENAKPVEPPPAPDDKIVLTPEELDKMTKVAHDQGYQTGYKAGVDAGLKMAQDEIVEYLRGLA